MPKSKLILDTCGLLWLTSGNPRLSQSARDRIEIASVVLVSAISAWEISLKSERGLLQLPLEPEEWFSKALIAHNLTLVALDVDIMTASNRLPWHHRDQADRFIITTALRENAVVVTADERFAAYGVETIV